MKSNYQPLKSELNQEIQTIKAPDYLRGHIRQKIENERQGSPKKQNLKRNIYYFMASAAVLTLTAVSGYTSPSMADVLSRVPLVGAIYENASADFGLKEAQKKGLTQGFQQTVSDKDIDMTIRDVYYDGQMLSIGFRLVNKGKVSWGEDVRGVHLDFDAKGYRLGQQNASTMLEKVSANEYDGLILLEADRFKEEFVLQLKVNEINTQKGSWDFDIPVTSEFLTGSIHTFAPNFHTRGIGADISIKELTFTPSGIRLIAETISEKGTGNNFGFTVKGVGVSGGGSGSFGSEHNKDGKDHIIHRVNLNPITEIPDQLTITIYDLNNELNGTNHEFHFNVPLK
jgi:hypothetical protein